MTLILGLLLLAVKLSLLWLIARKADKVLNNLSK
jgi:hypothetical protein